jgi:nitrogen fixation/metabolism regulation signal transduction histidine kinase
LLLEQRSKELEAEAARAVDRQRQLRIGLGIVLSSLVLAIGIAGIVLTHKIAGPIFKMKRLFREVGEGKLVLREKLRKGDELQHLFEGFEKMVNALRDTQKLEISDVDAVIEKLSAEGHGDSAASAALKKLRAEMEDRIT